MKRLWLKPANCASRYHAGMVKHAMTFDTHDGQPAPCNSDNEVLLDSENGTIRHQAFCLIKSGQVEWSSARLVQRLGGYYNVVEIARGTSFEEAESYCPGALAACQIAAEQRNPTYQPKTLLKNNTRRARKPRKSGKTTKSEPKLKPMRQSELLLAVDVLSKNSKGG